jgi:uncharacterized phiE125 gp8 family phage protein
MSLRTLYITRHSRLSNAVLETIPATTGTEVFTLVEVKAHLNKTDSDDDTYLTNLQKQCRQAVETYCSISIVGKTVTCTIRNQLGNIELPWGPHGSVVSIHDINGTSIATGNYTLRGVMWKYLESPTSDHVKIVINAGYSATGAAIPEDLKLAILQEIAYRYEHRGDENQELASERIGICQAARVLAEPHRRFQWL